MEPSYPLVEEVMRLEVKGQLNDQMVVIERITHNNTIQPLRAIKRLLLYHFLLGSMRWA